MVGNLLGLFRKPNAAEDPVCHMDVDIANPRGGNHEYNGQTYYFCGPGCRVAFSKEPEAYLTGQKKMEM